MPVRILPARGDKNCMFEFVGRSELDTRAHNSAIRTVMDDINKQRFNAKQPRHTVFHQVGSHEPNGPGYHGWEIWDASEAQMQEYLPKIRNALPEHAHELRMLYGPDAAAMATPVKLDPIYEKIRSEIEAEEAALQQAPAPERGR